jgi:O-antigen/teichoic acid export membrane protein
VIAGAGIALLMMLLAWPASGFFGEPRLAPILCTLSLAAAVQSWENIGPVAFRRDLEFRKEFLYLLIKRLGSVCVAVPAAVLLRNHWALVSGILAGRLLAVGTSYWIHPYRPRLTLAACRELFGFSRWMLLNNLLSFLKERSPDFVIGRTLGPASVGTYNMGAEIANMPTAELAAPVNRAMLPGYAVASRGTALAKTYLTTLGTLALFVIPAGCGLMSLADPIVTVLLGEKWRPAVPVLAIMSIHGMVAALQSLGYTLMIACNRPHVPARLNSIHVILMLALLVTFTSRYGLQGAALAYLSTALVMAPIMLYFVTRLVGIEFRDVMAVVWRPASASAAMVVTLWLWNPARLDATTHPGLVGLLAGVLVGATVYLGALAVLWLACGRPDGPERSCVGFLRSRGLQTV